MLEFLMRDETLPDPADLTQASDDHSDEVTSECLSCDQRVRHGSANQGGAHMTVIMAPVGRPESTWRQRVAIRTTP
ncbi:hypothetical protein PCANC_27279 [Puccinia coronata f. sp. avenae]|uniref:Uncharacterized protein n=1 Tax=Puccinia coronata f. sp. avenae TaxID=200324 RepID=A0A2N5TI37_9BASI|nr:hypothetical protein PCANC_27279 [Puccinia coronata f. sp. avenae]